MILYPKETERLKLREWQSNDLPVFAAMNADPAVMEYFPALLNEAQSNAFIDRIRLHFENYSFGLYALERKDTGSFIGFTGLMIPRFESYFTPCVEIGWRLSKENWGNGYAIEAAKACIQFGFDILQIEKIVSFTSVYNQRSEIVMKRIGMEYNGIFEHPMIDKSHFLCNHVLYSIKNPN